MKPHLTKIQTSRDGSRDYFRSANILLVIRTTITRPFYQRFPQRILYSSCAPVLYFHVCPVQQVKRGSQRAFLFVFQGLVLVTASCRYFMRLDSRGY